MEVQVETASYSYLKLLKREAKQFCCNTALHGYKFICKKDESAFIRFLWFLIIIISITIALCLVWWSYENKSQNVVDYVADSVHYPIWQYTFPALTICNLNKVSLNRTLGFINQMSNPSNFEKSYIILLFKYLAILLIDASPTYDVKNNHYYADLQLLLDANNLTAQNLLMRIRPECRDILRSCALKGRTWRCDSLFEEITTIEGFCCTSNYYALKNRFFNGYLSERYKKTPRKISACGHQTGYKILINNHPEDYLLASTSAIGTKIYIHDPYEYPEWSVNTDVVGMSEEKFIAILPNIVYATNAVMELKVSDRKCLFGWEQTMDHFRYYSESNCLTECRAKLIQNKCGCIPMFFWNLNFQEANKSTAIPCNITTAQCVNSLTDILFTFLPGYKYNRRKEFNFIEAEKQSLCKCLPNCELREYYTESSTTIFSRKHASNFNQFFNGINIENHSVISVYFKDLISTRYKKDVRFNWYSELAWYGGLLGLCLGFSFTSGFEILYYLSIRFYVNYFLDQNDNRKQQQRHKNKIHILSINYIDNINRGVPPLNKLPNLKKTNNSWYIE